MTENTEHMEELAAETLMSAEQMPEEAPTAPVAVPADAEVEFK